MDLAEADGARDLERALRLAWGPDTCAPEDVPDWTVDNPARGQCATTAMVVHDHLGGRLMRGEVLVDGTRIDFHWWNQLPDGREIDLTREQFAAHEEVTGGIPVERPTRTTRMDREYALLRDRVTNSLSASRPDGASVGAPPGGAAARARAAGRPGTATRLP